MQIIGLGAYTRIYESDERIATARFLPSPERRVAHPDIPCLYSTCMVMQ